MLYDAIKACQHFLGQLVAKRISLNSHGVMELHLPKWLICTWSYLCQYAMFIESPHPNYSVSITFTSHLYLLYDVINTPNTKFMGQHLISSFVVFNFDSLQNWEAKSLYTLINSIQETTCSAYDPKLIFIVYIIYVNCTQLFWILGQ